MYIPLKVTTDYTLLKSLIKIPDLITFLKNKHINVCGICDENLYGVYEFYFECTKNNIKPIIGLHINIDNLDIYLYAININGYHNLIKIHTLKEKNILDIDGLSKYKDDILCILPYKSKELYNRLNFYNKLYLSFSNSLERINLLVLTDKVLYLKDIRAFSKEDTVYLNYLDELRKEEKIDYSDSYYVDIDTDLGKLDEVVSAINLEFSFKKSFIPKYRDGLDSSKFLYDLSHKGLAKRLGGSISDAYLKRLDYELSIINKMGFVDYFLIVYDYVLFAKKNGIMVGPGRGSAAASLVSYAIGITEIDPLKYDLLFERFLNPQRVTMPDIDIDFDALRREEITSYIKGKYGLENVAYALTFNTLKSKLVLRDTGKILKINENLLDNFIKCIDGDSCLKNNLSKENVKKYLTNYKELKNLYKIAIHLEDLKKNTSIHAAGIVISSKQIDDIIPVHYDGDNLITGVTKEYLEVIGLLKMDILALKNLTTIKNIMDNAGIKSLNNIDLSEKKVYSLLSSGKTEGIFQFETPLMKNLAMKLKPTEFTDLVALLALARPGAIDEANEYIERKNNKKVFTYLHKDLEPILKDTYGIILYQEQIIKILGKIGGYSYAESDIIRRAISKKDENIINGEKDKFIAGSLKNGYTLEVANKIYDLIVKFASYGFNKAHSVAYALISYQMAYLKVKYSNYFIIELINNKDSDKIPKLISYLKRQGLRIEKPDINLSEDNYVIKNNLFIMPLHVIRGINSDISKKIIERREFGYLDYFDFVCKNKDILNDKVLSILIKADALRSFKINGNTLIENMESALNYAFIDDDLIKKPVIIEVTDFSEEEKRNNELEYFGCYYSNHPASIYQNVFKLENINSYLFKNVKCIILIERITKLKTKKGDDMAFLSGSDETGVSDFTVFPKNFDKLSNVNNGDLVEILGTVSKRFDKTSIIVNNIRKVG